MTAAQAVSAIGEYCYIGCGFLGHELDEIRYPSTPIERLRCLRRRQIFFARTNIHNLLVSFVNKTLISQSHSRMRHYESGLGASARGFFNRFRRYSLIFH